MLVPLADVLVFPPMDVFIRAATWPLMVFVVGLVLLVACTHLASFLLARVRSAQRDRGAWRWSRGLLARRLLAETTLLTLLAGGAGIGLAGWRSGCSTCW